MNTNKIYNETEIVIHYGFNGTIADFTGFYTTKLNLLLQLEARLQGPDDANKNAMFQILKVYEFHQLTDVAGDIPYSEALTGKENLMQKWISLFGNDYEVYANWRRTGYPVLTRVNYPGNVTGDRCSDVFLYLIRKI